MFTAMEVIQLAFFFLFVYVVCYCMDGDKERTVSEKIGSGIVSIIFATLWTVGVANGLAGIILALCFTLADKGVGYLIKKHKIILR